MLTIPSIGLLLVLIVLAGAGFLLTLRRVALAGVALIAAEPYAVGAASLRFLEAWLAMVLAVGAFYLALTRAMELL